MSSFCLGEIYEKNQSGAESLKLRRRNCQKGKKWKQSFQPALAGLFILKKIKERTINMMEKILILLSNNSFIRILLIAVTLDTLLGVLRAIKEHKFNSCVGIDGAIRKAAMLFSVCLLMATDVIMHINMLGMVPEKYIQVMGIQKLGICEFFCLLFILYEAVSILKNMTLCGLPVPAKIKKWIQKFLEDMTEELPEHTEENANESE